MTALTVEDLTLSFRRGGAVISQPLRGVNLEVDAGAALGIVGETGCGKSLTGYSVLGATPANAVVSGRICLDGTDLLTMPRAARQALRGKEIGHIPQNPGAALNPVHPIGRQLTLLTERHLGLGGADARMRIEEEFEAVGLDDPSRVFRSYPHELSGGMLQRVVIAAALLPRPQLLIADEPTTALDVIVERKILKLLRERQQELGISMLLITHDIGVVRSTCDTVAVLYAGRCVEIGVATEVLRRPRHPYTAGLISTIPHGSRRSGALHAIPGSVPQDLRNITGCAFAARCSYVQPDCLAGVIPSALVGVDHTVECLHPVDQGADQSDE